MHKSRFCSALLFVSQLFVLLPATAKAGLWEVPVGPGEQFRWVFVTSQTWPAISSDIDYYNYFVNRAADIGTPITDVVGFSSIAEIEWKAIGSTTTTDAKDNVGSDYAPVFTPLGDKVSNGTHFMWLGVNRDHPIIWTEYGTEKSSGDPWVWTGSDGDGRAGPDGFYFALGASWWVRTGNPWDTQTDQWLRYQIRQYSEFHSFYAISEVLTVVPVPSALILAATGLLSSMVGLKRLRRKYQE